MSSFDKASDPLAAESDELSQEHFAVLRDSFNNAIDAAKSQSDDYTQRLTAELMASINKAMEKVTMHPTSHVSRSTGPTNYAMLASTAVAVSISFVTRAYIDIL